MVKNEKSMDVKSKVFTISSDRVLGVPVKTLGLGATKNFSHIIPGISKINDLIIIDCAIRNPASAQKYKQRYFLITNHNCFKVNSIII